MSDIITFLGYVADTFFSFFGDLLGVVLENPLLLFAVIFSIMSSIVLLVLSFLKRFGVGKGRRRRSRR